MGTAARQRELWSAQVRDWANIQEGMVRPLYEVILNVTRIAGGVKVLDVGCGSGMFCAMAAQSGAAVTGLDATPELLAVAKERAPQVDFHPGEMEELHYPDAVFDIVTGFNAFQFAANPAKALSEARRVTKKGGQVVIAVWGKADDCEAAGMLKALGALMPPPPPGAVGPFALSQPGAIEALVTSVGLTPGGSPQDVDCPFIYPDEDTALRGFLSAGPGVHAIRASSEERVKEAVAVSIAPYRTPTGGYHLNNKFQYLVTTA